VSWRLVSALVVLLMVGVACVLLVLETAWLVIKKFLWGE
jgi:hypothetical protein